MFVDKLKNPEIQEIINLLSNDKFNVKEVFEPTKIKYWTSRRVTLQDKQNGECANAIMSDYCCYIQDIAYVSDYCNYMLRRFGSPYLIRADEKGVDSTFLLQNYITKAIEEGQQTTLNDFISYSKHKNTRNETTTDKVNSDSVTNCVKEAHLLKAETNTSNIKASSNTKTIKEL